MEGTTAERRTDRPGALDAATLAEAFQRTVKEDADRVALRTKDDGFSITWAEYGERVRRLAAGLAGLGVERGQTVALMLTNRPEFHLVDAAAMHLGATPFSVYNTYTPEQIEYLVGDAAPRVVVTEQAFLDRIKAGAGATEHIVCVDGGEGTLSLEDVEAAGEDGFDFDATWRAIEPGDMLTLIYTSGTTGPPKGVQLTHDNMMSTLRSYDRMIGFPRGGRIVSYLPMAHIAERNVSQYLPMACAFSVTCCPDPRQVIAYLPEVRPSWFFSVPRIWEKLKAGLEMMIAGEQDEDKRKAMQWAVEVGKRKVAVEQAGEELPEDLRKEYEQADELVLSKLRAQLGLDEIEACNVGAAPTPARGDRVLPRARHPAGGAVGHVGDHGRRLLQPARPDQDRHRRAAGAGLRDQARRGRRGADPRADRDARLPQPARQDRGGDRRRGLAAHRRHRRVRRRRLPEDRRPQEGADHQRGRQEHVAGEHRGRRSRARAR